MEQSEVLQINKDTLIKLQSRLGQNGIYDELFKAHEGKLFYVRTIDKHVVDNQNSHSLKQA